MDGFYNIFVYYCFLSSLCIILLSLWIKMKIKHQWLFLLLMIIILLHLLIWKNIIKKKKMDGFYNIFVYYCFLSSLCIILLSLWIEIKIKHQWLFLLLMIIILLHLLIWKNFNLFTKNNYNIECVTSL